MKKILIISDTHSHIDNTILKYVKDTDEVWHAGDIGNIKILTEIEVIMLSDPNKIFKTYKDCLNKKNKKSYLIIEHGDFYNDR